MPAQPHPPDPAKSDLFAELNDIKLSEVQPDKIEILIGADAKDVHIPTYSKRAATMSLSQFVRTSQEAAKNASFHHTFIILTSRLILLLLRRFWEK